MAGIGTLVAIPAVYYAFKSYRTQRTQLKELLDEKKREQASKVAVWIEDRKHGFRYVVVNQSELPVFGVYVWLSYGDRPHSVELLDTVPPGQAERRCTPMEVEGGAIVLPSNPEMLFMDADQLKWHRNRKGRLRELTEEEAFSILDRVSDVWEQERASMRTSVEDPESAAAESEDGDR
jgi:hypothetical protein